MRTNAVEWLAVALLAVAAPAVAADSLAGTWSLDDRSSDDPVHELDPRHRGDGLGRRIATGATVFGIPVGSLPLPGNDTAEEEPLSPEQIVGALAYVFEATYRLRIVQDDKTTQVRYGNAPTITYRAETVARNGWTSTAEWRDGELTVEHERTADGAHVSERYWVEARADELHWTARFKRPKPRSANVEVKRVFYRALGAENPDVPISAQLLP